MPFIMKSDWTSERNEQYLLSYRVNEKSVRGCIVISIATKSLDRFKQYFANRLLGVKSRSFVHGQHCLYCFKMVEIKNII